MLFQERDFLRFGLLADSFLKKYYKPKLVVYILPSPVFGTFFVPFSVIINPLFSVLKIGSFTGNYCL